MDVFKNEKYEVQLHQLYWFNSFQLCFQYYHCSSSVTGMHMFHMDSVTVNEHIIYLARLQYLTFLCMSWFYLKNGLHSDLHTNFTLCYSAGQAV